MTLLWGPSMDFFEILDLSSPNTRQNYLLKTIFFSPSYTANVYRGLRGFYGEIRVRGFQIYGDCMLPAFPAIFLKQKQQ